MHCSLLQARIWTLCVGSTLLFGPILGKTWRLYRVFTQRVPDKRVVGMLHLLVVASVSSINDLVFIFVIQSLQDALITFKMGFQRLVLGPLYTV